MANTADTITNRLHKEIDQIPVNRRAPLLKIVHAYREAVKDEEIEDINPRDSLRRALREVKAGKAQPIEGIWQRVGL